MTRISPMLLLAILAPAAISAQESPDCAQLLAGFKEKIEENYAGFHLEVKDGRRDAYDATFRRLASRASTTSRDDCYIVLDDFVRWFEDPHLFVFQSTRLDSAEARRRTQNVRVTDVTERSVRARLSAATNVDPIEGIWNDGRGLRLAVVPDPDALRRFMAVVVTSDTTTWSVGSVRASIARGADGGYRVDLRARNHALQHLRASIHKDVILRLSPGVWARELPPPPVPSLVDPTNPRRPTLVRRGGTVIVSLVSHDPTYASYFDSLVTANEAELGSADRLIVDLRGNEGGSSWMSNPLLPYIASRDQRATPYDGGTAVMLSSPAQIAYARRGFGPDTSAFVRELISRLEAAPGQLVPLPESPSRPPDTLFVGPDRVGVITDRGTVSASEVLVLAALRSTRAQVFGEPTAGALDYPSVNIVRVHPDERRWLLGYPTLATSAELPEGGMRGRGISPDVAVPVGGLWSAIEEIERRLGAGN